MSFILERLMVGIQGNQDKEPSLRVSTMRLWDGRLFYVFFAGGFIGLGLGTLILSYLQWTGDKAPALVGVCILVMAFIAMWLSKRPPRYRSIRAGSAGLVIEHRDGAETEVVYDDLRLCVPYVESLFTLLPGQSFAVDLLIRERFVRVYLSAPMRGELYRFIERNAPQTAFRTPTGSIDLPMPPDRYRSGWQHDSESLIHGLYRHLRNQAFITAILTSIAFVGLVAFQVLAAYFLGDQAIHGILILFIVVSAVLAVGGWWGVWGSVSDCRLFLKELREVDSLDPSDIEIVAGRLHLMIETGPPDEISAGTKWSSVLSVLLSCVPFVGLVFAIRALYFTWERDTIWNGIAWMGLIISIVGGFMSGFLIGSAIFGYESILHDF